VELSSLRLSLSGLEGMAIAEGELTAQLYRDPNGDGVIAQDGVLIAPALNVDPASAELVFVGVDLTMDLFEEQNLVVTMISTPKSDMSGCATTSGANSSFVLFLLALFLGRPRRRRPQGFGRRLGVSVALVTALVLTLGACGRAGFEPRYEGQLHLDPSSGLQITSELWPDIAAEGASLDGQRFLIIHK
jgi:MYXO-CTERM domain-containing protein